ncbi:hypothetical protein FHS95_001323 [Sphingomonas naasensis]|uniref:Uncharacterized protein n=1 Tax=Sphingomonas naasensis TaxID=1344951 RepID=A0A4S1W344_9SPHN|nr:hypothetical protein [Sphingomonas naasensis]NIJ19654.1 hypothetical protein [Sphingomonas naasensis]TGX37274.1 hypothetical protein E5A74_20220 [Sphingomonas naasensis]
MPVLLKRCITGAAYTPFDADQPDYFRGGQNYYEFRAGRCLWEPGYDHITSATQERKTAGRIPDIITVRTIRVCSQRFKDFVESWEPGLHFFEPFTLRRKTGEDLGAWYKYSVGQDIDCLLTAGVEQHFSSYPDHDGGTRWNFDIGNAVKHAHYSQQHPDKADTPPLRVSGAAIEGAHWWTMGLLGLHGVDSPMLMSDAMYAAFRKEKFREFDDLGRVEIADQPWRAEENMGPMLDQWRAREAEIARRWPADPPRRGRAAG